MQHLRLFLQYDAFIQSEIYEWRWTYLLIKIVLFRILFLSLFFIGVWNEDKVLRKQNFSKNLSQATKSKETFERISRW